MKFIVIFMMLWERPFSWTLSITFSSLLLIKQKHIRVFENLYNYVEVNAKEKILFLTSLNIRFKWPNALVLAFKLSQ